MSVSRGPSRLDPETAPADEFGAARDGAPSPKRSGLGRRASGEGVAAPGGITPPTLTGAGRRFLSDLIVELGFADADTVAAAVEAARRPGMTVEKVLVAQQALTEDQLARALAERYGLDHIDLSAYDVDRSAAGLLQESSARRYGAVPVGFSEAGSLLLAVADPSDSLGLSDIAVMTKLAVRPAVASRSQIDALTAELTFMAAPVSTTPQALGNVIVPAPLGGPAPAAAPLDPDAAEPPTPAPAKVTPPGPLPIDPRAAPLPGPARAGGEAGSFRIGELGAQLPAEGERASAERAALRQPQGEARDAGVGADAPDGAAHAGEAPDRERHAGDALDRERQAHEVVELRRLLDSGDNAGSQETARLRDMLETERAKRDELVSTLRATVESERASQDALTAKLRATIEEQHSRYANELASARSALEQEQARRGQALADARERHEAELTRQREGLDAEHARLTAEHARLAAEAARLSETLREERALHSEELAGHGSAVDAEREKRRETISELRTQGDMTRSDTTPSDTAQSDTAPRDTTRGEQREG